MNFWETSTQREFVHTHSCHIAQSRKSTNMPESRSLASDLANAARGVLMGAADIIPGVSGGTVALLLGIYPRLLTAISHVDGELWRLLRGRNWSGAARHLDLRFLLTLAIGILSGILTLAGVLHRLLHDYRQQTLAAFFGLILASGIVVLRMVKPTSDEQRVWCVVLGALAAVFAAWLVLGGHLQPREGLAYVFVCGAIAICAMILPGVSGAYILVLLGKYEAITEILHKLKAGEADSGDLVTLAVFSAGCLVGLIAFSKVLKALLARYYSPTMAVLGGFMIGSLAKVWPFQQAIAGEQEITKTTITKPVMPEALDAKVATCAVIAVVAFVAVVAADSLARNRREKA